MYENRFGRFTAVDPLLASGKSANPQSFNRFIYVVNDPINLSDPLGLDPWWRGNCKDGRCQYVEQNEKPTKGTWEAVTFNNGYAQVNSWSDTGRTAYLYSNGGQDFGLRAQVLNQFALDATADNSYCAVSRECLAVRNSQVRSAGANVMAMGVPFLNFIPGTFNLAATGVNYFGGNLPYAPTLTLDNTATSGQKMFYYGTEAALIAEGGLSLYRGIKSGLNFLRNGDGILGQEGLQVGKYEINGLYKNEKGEGGTIFSAKQVRNGDLSILQSKPTGGNFIRLDYGVIHGTDKMALHTAARLTLRGRQFGSTAQRTLLFRKY